MTKNEEISNLINPPNKLNEQDFIKGLGNAVIDSFNRDIKNRYSSISLEFYFIQMDIFSSNIGLNAIDVSPINDGLQELNTFCLKESPIDILGKHTNLMSQIAEHLIDSGQESKNSIPLQLMKFYKNHVASKFPTLRIKFEIDETLSNNYWL